MLLSHIVQTATLFFGGHFSRDLKLVKTLEQMLGDGTIVEIQRFWYTQVRETCTINGVGYSYNSEYQRFDSGHNAAIEVALAGVGHTDLCRALDALRWEPRISYTKDKDGIERFRADGIDDD